LLCPIQDSVVKIVAKEDGPCWQLRIKSDSRGRRAIGRSGREEGGERTGETAVRGGGRGRKD
jgi:hypothetical protein